MTRYWSGLRNVLWKIQLAVLILPGEIPHLGRQQPEFVRGELTARNRIVPERLIVAELVKKFSAHTEAQGSLHRIYKSQLNPFHPMLSILFPYDAFEYSSFYAPPKHALLV
jgi:hypothetical protein